MVRSDGAGESTAPNPPRVTDNGESAAEEDDDEPPGDTSATEAARMSSLVNSAPSALMRSTNDNEEPLRADPAPAPAADELHVDSAGEPKSTDVVPAASAAAAADSLLQLPPPPPPSPPRSPTRVVVAVVAVVAVVVEAALGVPYSDEVDVRFKDRLTLPPPLLRLDAPPVTDGKAANGE